MFYYLVFSANVKLFKLSLWTHTADRWCIDQALQLPTKKKQKHIAKETTILVYSEPTSAENRPYQQLVVSNTPREYECTVDNMSHLVCGLHISKL